MRVAAEIKINAEITEWEARENERHQKGSRFMPPRPKEESISLDELTNPTALLEDEDGEVEAPKLERRGFEFKDTIEVEWLPFENGYQALMKEIPSVGEAEHTPETLRACWEEYGPIEDVKINASGNK